MSNTANVTTAKPKIGGAIFSAPLGTKLPVTATEALDGAFKALGYVSEDGLTNESATDSEKIKAWGGDTVITVVTGKEDSFSYTLIESLNIDVLKEVYGPDNVTGNLASGIVIKSNASELPTHIIVIDTILKGDVLKRIVVPVAKVAEVGEITYQDGEAIGYETTLDALPDSLGNTHYEHIQSKPTV